MSYDERPLDPYERIGTTGGFPGAQSPSRRQRSRRVSSRWITLALIALGVIWWRSGDSKDASVQAAEPHSVAPITLDAPPKSTSRGAAGSRDLERGDLETKTPVEVPASSLEGGLQSQASKADFQKSKPSQPALARKLEGVIAKWMGEASHRSKGKVSAKNTTVALHVRALDGQVWVDRSGSRALVPASNLKLLTSAAAVILGEPGAAFVTRFEALGPIEAGVLRGHLVARAGADPWYFDGSDGSLDRWLDPLAEELARAGVHKVQGALVLDEGDFGPPGPAQDWPDPRDYWKEYCALAGGFSANAGCLTAILMPRAPGTEAETKIAPQGHGLIRSDARVQTVGKGKALTVAVEARNGRLIVRGSLPADVPRYEARFAHPDPVELFGSAVVQGLAQRGIVLEQGYERRRQAERGVLVATVSSPILEAIVPILKESNNAVADQLFLWLGHRFGGEGTRGGGTRAVAVALDTLGLDRTGWTQVDGSGLSKANRVRADLITALLAGVLCRQDEAARTFRRSLPVAGESGTLSDRMGSGSAFHNVHAKTGFVDGASSLSGLVQTKGGDQVVFSILVDYPKVSGMNTSVFKPMQDELCQVLASFQAGAQ